MAEEITLRVFAASSLTEPLIKIQELYQEQNSEVTLEFHFDSSGTLKMQIEEGVDCDLFFSAAERQMDQLEELGLLGNCDGIHFLPFFDNGVKYFIIPGPNCENVEFNQYL